MRQRNGGTDSRHRLSNMDSQVVLSIHVHLFFERVEKSTECSVCMLNVIGGGTETFDSIMTTVRKEFDFGAWDVGNFQFKGRQISQMPNGEIVCDMEQYKHELEQIDVSKADKTKPERLLNSKEHTQFRGGVGSLGWFVDHCCPQLSFQLAELRRKQASPNKVIRAAKVIESKIKIRSIPVEHLRFSS